jgi:hypothetical protein
MRALRRQLYLPQWCGLRHLNWLQRMWHPSSVLLIALCLLFAEPITCLIHCQIYVPWLVRHQRVHQHQQRVQHVLLPMKPDSQSVQPFVTAPDTATQGSLCFQVRGDHPSSGLFTPPSPVHDILLLTPMALIGLALSLRLRVRAPLRPPDYAIPPPTPPPLPLPH